MLPNENKKLDRALDGNEINMEQLRQDYPELYKEIKNSLPAWMQHPDKMPKSMKASDISPLLAQKLFKNGLMQLDPETAELLDKRVEEEQQNAHKKAQALRQQLDDAVNQINRQQTDMDDMRKKNQRVYKKIKDMDADFEEEDVYGDQRIPGAAGSQPRNAAGVRSDRFRQKQGYIDDPIINLQDLKRNDRELYKDVLDDIEGNYDSPDQIPNEIPMMQISSADLRKKVANLLKAIDTNKELDGVAPTRIGMMLKALNKPNPADGEEIITPEEAQELLEKARKKLIDLKADELKALKNIAQQSPDYKFEDVNLLPNENKKLDRALDGNEINMEQLRQDYPELYKEIKNSLPAWMQHPDKMPKSMKASDISPLLAQKLFKNGLMQLDPETAELLDKRVEEEQQNAHKKAQALRQQLDDAVNQINRQQTDMDDMRKKNQRVYKKIKDMDADFEEEDVYGDQRIPGAAGSQPRNAAGVRSDRFRQKQGYIDDPIINLQDLKRNDRELYKDVLDDIEGNYDSPDQIPNEIPMMQISSADLRKKVANLLKAIDTNKELDGVAPTRIGMMLKALNKPNPADGEEIITPEEAQELLEKARKKLIDLKADELKALKNIAQQSPDYKFEDVNLLPNENKKLDRALDGNEINMEQLRQDYPELYKEIKNSLPAWMQHPDKMPKSMKASDISPLLAQKLFKNGLMQLDPETAELLDKRVEEEQQNAHKKAQALRQQLDDAVNQINRQQTDMDDMRKKNQRVYKKIKDMDADFEEEDVYGDQRIPGAAGSQPRNAAGVRSDRFRQKQGYIDDPIINLQDLKRNDRELYKDVLDDIEGNYDSPDQIPNEIPMMQISSADLRKKVANLLKAIDTNKELDGVAPTRIGMMLKALNKPNPADGEEIITPEEAQELLEKARKKLIDLKADELKALKNIAQQSPDYKFEDVNLLPNENKKLDRALDGNEINMEQLRQDYPELYKEIKNSLPAWMQHPDKMPKSMKASDISPLLAQKLFKNGLMQLDPETAELLDKRVEEEQQNAHKKAQALRQQLDDAVNQINRQQTDMDDMRKKNQRVYKKIKDMDADFEEEDVYGDQRIPGAAGSQPRNAAGVRSDRFRQKQGYIDDPIINLQDLKRNDRELYKDVLDDIEGNYDSPDQIPNEIPMMQISSADLRKKVANLLKAIDTNKELDGVAPTRIGMMLKALNKPNPADGEEIITPEEAQELLEKARKKLIDLKADELKALKNIAQQSPDYKFEDVNLLPNENKKLDRALDGNEINMEQLRQDYPELYKEIKNSLPAWMQHPDKMPKSMKASDISPLLAQKLFKNGLMQLDPETAELLDKRVEEEQQNAHKKAQALRQQLDDAVNQINRQQTDMDDMRKKNQRVYKKIKDMDADFEEEDVYGDQRIPGAAGSQPRNAAGVRSDRFRQKQGYIDDPIINLQDLKRNDRELYKDVLDDIEGNYDSPDQIPNEIPMMQISSADLRKKVANLLKAIDTNKELDGVAPTRIGMMLKALNKPNPADGEEIITPEEAQELLEKARKKLIDLKADELKALKNIAQQSPDYKFEDVNLLPNENKKLDRALDGNEINMEQLRQDYPELYKEIKNSLPAWMQHPDKMPKSMKASDISPLLAQKLFKNGLMQLDPETAELLDKRVEEEQQNAHKKAQALRQQLDDAVNQINRQQTDMDDMRKKNQRVYKKIKDMDADFEEEDVYGDQRIPGAAGSQPRNAAGVRSDRFRQKQGYIDDPIINLQDLKRNDRELYKDVLDDIEGNYDSPDQIPNEIPMMQISSADLRKKVANLLKAIDTNKELDGVAPTRIGMMLKALNKPNPADGEEIITPEEAQELLEKARKKLIDLKADELKALKNIAQQSPDYKFEDVNLLPNENKKLDRALDGNEINMEQLRQDYPELYKEIKKQPTCLDATSR